MFLKKICFIVGVILFLVSCNVLNPEVYCDDEARILFTFPYELGYGILFPKINLIRFFDTNPKSPDNSDDLWNDFMRYGPRYYKINPGQYYLEYVHENNAAYYIIYTINIYKNSGGIHSSDGYQYLGNGNDNDHYIEFEIWLKEDGPKFYDGNAVSVRSEPITGEIQKSPFRSIISNDHIERGPIIEILEMKVGSSSIVMEYGRLY